MCQPIRWNNPENISQLLKEMTAPSDKNETECEFWLLWELTNGKKNLE